MKIVLQTGFSVAALLFFISPVSAQTSRAVRECAEAVLSRFGPKAAGETIEGVSKKIANAVSKYGDETLPAFKKVGAPAFAAAEEAAETALPKLKLMARQGTDAVSVYASPKKMAIFIKNGDDAADAMIKHKGIAEAVLESWGKAAARPLNAISSTNAKRLAIMNESGELAKLGKTDEVLAVIGKYGDSAMDFIWRNKGSLVVGTTLAAFLANPEPYINGVTQLVEKPLEGSGKVIAEKTNWTIVILFGMSLAALRFGYWLWTRQAKAVVKLAPDSSQNSLGNRHQNQTE